MNLTIEQYNTIYPNESEYAGAQEVKEKENYILITTVIFGEFTKLAKTKKEVIKEAMKSDEGRYLLKELCLYKDYYICRSYGDLSNKAMDIPLFNDGESFFIEDLNEEELTRIKNSIEGSADDINDYKVINLWT